MSDLVTKVVKEIAICRKSGGIKCDQVCDYCKDDATRAIKAVAEWIKQERAAMEGVELTISDALLAQLEGSK